MAEWDWPHLPLLILLLPVGSPSAHTPALLRRPHSHSSLVWGKRWHPKDQLGHEVKASAALTDSEWHSSLVSFCFFIHTKMMTEPQGRKPPPSFQPHLAPGQIRRFVFVTASSSGSPPSLDVSFSHSFISPTIGLDSSYTPSPFLGWTGSARCLGGGLFVPLKRQQPLPASLLDPPSHSWSELELGQGKASPQPQSPHSYLLAIIRNI